ncbi:MAG TPA: hypothetical protein VEZ13_04260 [Brevibacillus sp.]|nr:hypothetical protein [Brevibacillus sp.]
MFKTSDIQTEHNGLDPSAGVLIHMLLDRVQIEADCPFHNPESFFVTNEHDVILSD